MKYFVISDIHSFYKEMRAALKTAGYDIKNKNHTLVVCGDIFDRGDESLEVYKFLRRVPKSRLKLIKGNHEQLLLELLEKDFPQSHDFSNGTAKTVCHLTGYSKECLQTSSLASNDGWKKDWYEYAQQAEEYFKQMTTILKDGEVIKWIKSSQWLDYFELDKYIFVHSFIPLINNSHVPAYYAKETSFEYNPNWRTQSSSLEWEDSRWGCPWSLFNAGLFDSEKNKGKVLVCGHWHSSDFHEVYNDDHSMITKMSCPIFISDNLIALDACTAMSGRVNVLVIEDDLSCHSGN